MKKTKKSSALYAKVPISVLAFDATNPRDEDVELLNKIQISLERIGLIMPIVAFENGIILGGHQRVKTLKRMGVKEVYVNFIKNSHMADRITINIYLNRVIQELHNSSRDIVFEKDTFFEKLQSFEKVSDPGLALKSVKQDKIINTPFIKEKNLIQQENYLYSKGIRLPVVVDEDYNIVMGKTRAYLYRSLNKKAPIIMVKNSIAPYVSRALSGVSNKFNFDDTNYLRTSSRRHIISNNISSDMMSIYGKYKPSYNFGIYAHGVKRKLGENILDFGAGNGKQTALLRQHGINITLFEPFVPRANAKAEVSIIKTINSYENFLSVLSRNEVFTSVIANAVLNSVATKDDLRKVVYLLRVLSTGGKLYGTTRSKFVKGDSTKGFSVDSDTRITAGHGKLKIQNFVKPESLQDYFEDQKVETKYISKYLYYECRNPYMEISEKRLIDAINTEFNFYYTDRNLDFSDKAKEIFFERLKKLESAGLCKIK